MDPDINKTETQTVTRNPTPGIFDETIPPAITPQSFADEDTLMQEKRNALPHDAKDKDHYFRGLELIPGFPFFEFQGAPQKIKHDTVVNTTSYHTVTQSFLGLIQRTPPEIRTHIFAQIPIKRVAEDEDLDSEGYIKKSVFLMLPEYAPLNEELQFAPVKYSIRTARDDSTEVKQNSPKDANGEQSPGPSISLKNSSFRKTFAVLISNACEEAMKSRSNISYIENDYPVAFARSHIDYVRFVASLAHSEGFYFEESPSGWGPGIWKSEIRETSLLGEFLAWFWKNFILNFTNELDACIEWLDIHYRKFQCLRNISIDILTSSYDEYPSKRKKRSIAIDARRFKQFLKKLENLPNIDDLTVYVQVENQDFWDLIYSPGAFGWVNALRGVTFAKSFDVHLIPFAIVPKDYKESPPPSNDDKKQFRIYEERLRQLLMPEVLCYGTTDDVPDDLGLMKMFDEDEE